VTRTVAAVAGGLAAALGASLCCVGPVLAVFAGIGGAGLSAFFEPLRPYLLGASAALFVWAGVALHRDRGAADCATGTACRTGSRMRSRVVFWTATGVAAGLASFPSWSKLLV
jgi:mercuric ion transport protein